MSGVSSDDASARLKSVRREPPPFRRIEVRSIDSLSEHMVRIVFGGDELDGFAIEGPASSVRLLFPSPGQDEIEMPTWTGNQWETADGDRAPIRTFTPRYVIDDPPHLTVDFVVHEQGLATDWARSAEVGDEIAVSGPGRVDGVPNGARSMLLVGDESALPAIGQLLESIPSDRTVTVHAEVRSSDARIDLPEHPGVEVTWHETAADAAPGDALVAAVTAIAPADLPDHIWIAGEAAAVQRLRTHLFDECDRTRKSVTARGYWKHDR